MKIKTLLIEQDEESLSTLKGLLHLFPDIELMGAVSETGKIRDLLSRVNPDLVFIDVKLADKIKDFYSPGDGSCMNVLCASDKGDLVCILHQSALDILLKPLHAEDVQEVVDRCSSRMKNKKSFPCRISIPSPADIVSLPTLTGLQFINVRDIVLFQCEKDRSSEKSQWNILLTNFQRLKLRKSITAKEIGRYLDENRFAQINQSIFVNCFYLEKIEYKTHVCKLISPFDEIELVISRTFLTGLKERFEIL
ncbi:MAG: LytR/AlgR family response regulator transcription factor [Mangrovibacterium sp.]